MQAECVLLWNIISVAQETVNHFDKILLKECKFAQGGALVSLPMTGYDNSIWAGAAGGKGTFAAASK